MIILHCEPSTSVELQIETPILIVSSAFAAVVSPPAAGAAPPFPAGVLPPAQPASIERDITALSNKQVSFFFMKT